MRKLKFLLLVAATALQVTAYAVEITPKPVEQIDGKGKFVVDAKTTICYNALCSDAAKYLGDRLNSATALKFAHRITDTNADGRNTIQLVCDSSTDIPTEGYILKVSDRGVKITGKDRSGVFYGVQSLLQLMPTEVFGKELLKTPFSVKSVDIKDYPRFPYRGFMLDNARVFFDIDVVKRQIDMMAMHKLNKFHWHLTDDEGWRIEIKSHPDLTRIGAFRGGDSPVRSIYGFWDTKYGGYFTQEQIKDVIAYAAERCVEVIPEIDLPGHSRTIAAIYPSILCSGPIDTVTTAGYDRRNVWCAAKNANYELLSDILTEISALFPSKYIHIGGDEVDMSQWLSCPACKELMKSNNLKTGHQVEEYFMEKIEDILVQNGKTSAVWNEAIKGGNLSKSTRVYGWQDGRACFDALSNGYSTVIMPGQYFYIDMKQSPGEGGHLWAGITPPQKTYSFSFEKAKYTEQMMKNIIGVEGAFWAEVPLYEGDGFLEYQLYPRLCAVAEIGWTPESLRSWDDFRERMNRSHFARLTNIGCNVRLFPPVVSIDNGAISATTTLPDATIRYTTDGSEPNESSPIFKTPLTNSVARKTMFRIFYNGSMSPKIAADSAYYRPFRPRMTLTSSIPENPAKPYTNINIYEYKKHSATSRTPLAGDYFLFTFDDPVDCASILVTTGQFYMQRGIVRSGYVEVSYDGVTYSRVAEVVKGQALITPAKPVKAVKLTCTYNGGNGESHLIIYPPEVTPH